FWLAFWPIVCLGLSCEVDTTPSLENRECTRDGRCLAGYTCSPQRICVKTGQDMSGNEQEPSAPDVETPDASVMIGDASKSGGSSGGGGGQNPGKPDVAGMDGAGPGGGGMMAPPPVDRAGTGGGPAAPAGGQIGVAGAGGRSGADAAGGAGASGA